MAEKLETVSDGKQIRTWRWAATGPPRGVVFVIHGLAEHVWRKGGGGYPALAECLSRDGWAVVAFDQRAHGATDPESLGVVRAGDGSALTGPRFERLLADSEELYNRIVPDVLVDQAGPSPRVVLLGHSMGSIEAQVLAPRVSPTPCAVILSGCPVLAVALAGIRLSTSVGMLTSGVTGALKMLPQDNPLPIDYFQEFNNAVKPPGEKRTSCDWLSRSEAANVAYEADPWCGWRPSVGLFGGLSEALAGCRGGKGSEEVYGPKVAGVRFLVVLGQADPCGGGSESTAPLVAQQLLQQFQRHGANRPQIRLYAGCRHELLNEPEDQASQVRVDIRDWLRCGDHSRL